jgi:hypothetical protein
LNKKKQTKKIMKALIPISKKKLGIITAVKWTIQKLQHQ